MITDWLILYFYLIQKANFKIKTNAQSQEDEDEDEDQFDEYILTKENLINFGKMVMPYFKILPKPTFL